MGVGVSKKKPKPMRRARTKAEVIRTATGIIGLILQAYTAWRVSR